MEENFSRISFNQDILQARGVTIDGLKYYIINLSEILKKRFPEVVPTQIFDTHALDRILSLHHVLTEIKDISGSDRHFNLYTEPQFSSTFFVSRFALFLKDNVDEIELEPITNDTDGNPDIRIVKNGYTAFIECKNIETEQFNNLEEHRKVFETIEELYNFPHQITISYKESPSREKIIGLTESINKLVETVSTNGNLISNEEYEVNIQLRDGFGDPQYKVLMEGILGDVNSGERKLGHIFFENGKSIAIFGPEIDYRSTVQSKIRAARNQHVPGEIFIVAINSDPMLGYIKENFRHVEAMFQPNQNTRYSSVLLANSQALVGEGEWHKINNPFAEVPIVSEIDNIFRN